MWRSKKGRRRQHAASGWAIQDDVMASLRDCIVFTESAVRLADLCEDDQQLLQRLLESASEWIVMAAQDTTRTHAAVPAVPFALRHSPPSPRVTPTPAWAERILIERRHQPS